MKIKSYQVGGVVYTPFVPNQAQTTSGTSSKSTSKSSDSDEDGKLTGIKKEQFGLLTFLWQSLCWQPLQPEALLN